MKEEVCKEQGCKQPAEKTLSRVRGEPGAGLCLSSLAEQCRSCRCEIPVALPPVGNARVTLFRTENVVS